MGFIPSPIRSIISSYPIPPAAYSPTLLMVGTSLAIRSSTFTCLSLEDCEKDFYSIETSLIAFSSICFARPHCPSIKVTVVSIKEDQSIISSWNSHRCKSNQLHQTLKFGTILLLIPYLLKPQQMSIGSKGNLAIKIQLCSNH